MKGFFIVLFAILFFTSPMMSQEAVQLYQGKIPGSKPVPVNYKETIPEGRTIDTYVTQVSLPQLFVYLPVKEKATGAAVIICPGGGYSGLAIGHEGVDVAKMFNEIGVAAFVLKYRLPSDKIMENKSIGPLMDASQAIRLVRSHADQYNINPNKIGIMGFSAGGHLASTLTVHYGDSKISNKEKISLRPDFSVLIYPVISFFNFAHAGSVNNLLGVNATQAQKEYFSTERHINSQTPPTFLVHANDDEAVPAQNSIIFNQALVKIKLKSELHLYQNGGHGFGLNNKTTDDEWFKRLENWMRANKFI